MNALEKNLTEILDTMNVPPFRKDVTKSHNLLWLKRNLFIHNGQHPELPTAISFINNLLTQKGEQNDSLPQ